MDVLSLVGLTTHLARVFREPSAELQDGAEWFSLARWYEVLELHERAEEAYRCALQFDLPQDRLEAALRQLGLLLKRAGRRDDAAEVWQHLAAVEMDGVRGHVELAKYHEWHTGELEQAADWTRRALSLAGHWSRGMQQLTRPELEHRLARLERKLG
jgi:tetratricopeptide (TPR) repeat protein